MTCKVNLSWQSTINGTVKPKCSAILPGLFEMAVCCAKPPYLAISVTQNCKPGSAGHEAACAQPKVYVDGMYIPSGEAGARYNRTQGVPQGCGAAPAVLPTVRSAQDSIWL